MESQKHARHGTPSSIFQSPTFDADVRIRVNDAVGAASISPSGRDVVLASRHGLDIIDLDAPDSPPRHLPHQTPWEVADVQWSPFASRYYWIVSTSNQRALVWNLEKPGPYGHIEHILHAHSRAVTDINFSAHHPDVLATCAVDSYVHCWDLREPQRPVVTFCDWFAGATQVKWNRQDPHILASSHDRYLHIWDDRKGAYPVRTIDAHETKIYGLDWNRINRTKIMTCSLDKTIKLWDYSLPEDEPERIIRTPFPVWRARHTPFGWGVLAMPQRGDHRLHLYDSRFKKGMLKDGDTESVHTFSGHRSQVKEFLWRTRGNIDAHTDSRDFQLVSWGTDNDLILHRLKEKHLRPVGYSKGMTIDGIPPLTRMGTKYISFREGRIITSTEDSAPKDSQRAPDAMPSTGFHGAESPSMSKAPIPVPRGWADGGPMMTYSGLQTRRTTKEDVNLITWMKGVRIGKRGMGMSERHRSRSSILSSDVRASGPWDGPENLRDEIIRVGDTFKKVTFDEADISKRTARMSLNGPWGLNNKPVYMTIKADFPVTYPEMSAAHFRIAKMNSISDEIMQQISADVKSVAEAYMDHGRGCLEAVLSYLLGERALEDINPETILGVEGDESSSDEDDGDAGNFAIPGSQNLEMSGPDLSNVDSANTNVPLPKACGALWAQDGRLVCFFPSKEEVPSLLRTIALNDSNRSLRGKNIFEGFGRLHTESPEPKNKPSLSQSILVDAEESDEWTSSSSSSSGSSHGLDDIPARFNPPMAWRGATLHLQRHRSRSAEGSQRMSAGIGVKSSATAKPKIIVSVYAMDSMLPAQRSLAEKYQILGDGPTVCAHNAIVAAQYGFDDLASIWSLAKFILCNDVPLEVMPQSRRKEEILVIAKRVMVCVKRRDSGLDLSFDEPGTVADPPFQARVKWGSHPLGGRWLIDAMFVLNHPTRAGRWLTSRKVRVLRAISRCANAGYAILSIYRASSTKRSVSRKGAGAIQCR
ncbi:hypothetical protein LTR66_012311 [Elasticomyces elasticus]|nr:hypothetical protein LTR66_012311 [Elasticomyces elasticus]